MKIQNLSGQRETDQDNEKGKKEVKQSLARSTRKLLRANTSNSLKRFPSGSSLKSQSFDEEEDAVQVQAGPLSIWTTNSTQQKMELAIASQQVLSRPWDEPKTSVSWSSILFCRKS